MDTNRFQPRMSADRYKTASVELHHRRPSVSICGGRSDKVQRFCELAAALLFCSGLARAGDFRVERDIPYLGEGRAEKADLYLPEGDSGQRPAVVDIHGGGWSGGDKAAAREVNICTNLAANGYVAMSINYVLQQKGGPPVWPKNLHDCKTAVRWLRVNAERLRIDGRRIGVIGGSAGGHLAAMVGVTGRGTELDPQGPFGDQPCDVQAVVDLYGPITWMATRDLAMFGKTRAEAPELYRLGSPLGHLDKADPPILIIHGTDDKTVELEQSRVFAAALEAAGVEHQLITVEGGPHSFHLQPKQMDLRAAVLGFFNKHLKRQ